MVTQVTEMWAQLEAHFQRTNPAQLIDLNGPASAADIAALEGELGLALPIEFKECIARHDGQAGRADWLFGSDEFLPTSRILANWRVLTDMAQAGEFDDLQSIPDVGVKAGWWSPSWVPFTADGAGNHLCLDLDPAPGGRVGQIVQFDHEFENREVQAPGFAQWFDDFTRATVAPIQRGGKT